VELDFWELMNKIFIISFDIISDFIITEKIEIKNHISSIKTKLVAFFRIDLPIKISK
jgi:hypothetical protein